MFLKLCFLLLLGWNIHAIALKPGGRNVCERKIPYSTNEVVTVTKVITTYYQTCCKRVFAKCVKYCQKSRTITQKVTKVQVVGKIRSDYFCCNDWTNQASGKAASKECIYPVCRQACHPGTCISPNKCQIIYDAQIGFEKAVLNKKTCGGDIINIVGTIDVSGDPSKAIQTTQACQWNINIPYYQKTKFYFTRFKFPANTHCADTVVTISTSRMEFFFCSEKQPKIGEGFEFDGQNFLVKIVKNNWHTDSGVTLKFKDAYT